MELILRNAIRPAGLLLAILVFSCSFISWGQSTDPSQPITIDSLLNQSSSGPAQSSALVDGSVLGSVSSMSLPEVSVANASANAQLSGTPGSASSGRARMSAFEAGSSQFNQGAWGAEGGWGRVSSMAGSDSKSSTAGRGGSIATLRRAIAGGAVGTAYKSTKTLSTASTLYALGGAGVAATASEYAPRGMSNAKGFGSVGKGGGSASGGNYSRDFPDSTKSAGVISPPDPANNPVFSFDPSFGGRGFPDLADYQFLKPSLHVGAVKTSAGYQEEDLYRRIERRLNEHRGAATGTAKSNGLKKDTLRRPAGLARPVSTSSALRSLK